MNLTDADRAALDLEGQFWKHASPKEDAIRRELNVTPTRHYQTLLRLRWNPAAWQHAPAAMGRIDRLLRASRRRSHAGE